MQRHECCACRYVYDERIGEPDDGIAPGTRWAQVPSDWGCPDCGRPKSGFANMAD
ncbi:rubredoxin [Azoarcus sp. DN11]|uniref:rubredoxin n=1 Tax=Azoarcus sp. DN11 TaxID=356837 RepID=UPI000EAF927B|nr:rubredoxin [Azoarcus sp. DN11]AYH44049.1 rubredoxin [Azoarcus sp. DN11]